MRGRRHDEKDDDISAEAEHDEKDDISAEAEHDEEDDISAEAEHNKKNVIESMTRDDANIETNATEKGGKIKYDEEYLNYISSLPIYQPPQHELSYLKQCQILSEIYPQFAANS